MTTMTIGFREWEQFKRDKARLDALRQNLGEDLLKRIESIRNPEQVRAIRLTLDRLDLKKRLSEKDSFPEF